jgi:hypothetical protein
MARHPATVSVEIAWSPEHAGEFHLDTSQLNSTDTLGGDFGGNVFDDLSDEVKSVQITRGRGGDLSVIEQGRCVLELKDSTGKYNPENPASPLAPYLDTHKPVRVSATHLGTTYRLFYGFISKIEHDPAKESQSSRIEAVDFFEWLNAAKPVIAATGQTTVGTVIGLLLDALTWNDPSKRDLDVGRFIPNFSSDGTRSALQLIEDLLEVDLGIVFVNGNGVVVFVEGDARWSNVPPFDTFGNDVMSLARPGIDKQNMINRQTVVRTGGTPQTYTDPNMPPGRPFYDGEVIDSPYLSSDGQALSLATMIVTLRRGGRPPTRGIVLWDRDDTAILKQMRRELADSVEVTEALGGTSLQGAIAGLTHELAPGGLHKTTYLVTKRLFAGWTIDGSLIDGPDVLTY